MRHQVVVVGAGLSGLFTTSALLDAGIDDVLLLEAAVEPGGVTRTIHRDGYQLEPAAGTLLLPHPALTPLLEHLGVETIPAVGADVRYVYDGDRLVALPASPKAVLAPLVPWNAKLIAALEPFRRPRPASPDESLDAFLRRRLGAGLGRSLAWIAAAGVFAGDPTRLSARAAFPGLPALEDSAGSIVGGTLQRMRARPRGATRPRSHVAAGGMSALAEAGARRLGDRCRLGFSVDSLHRTNGSWFVEGEESVEAEHVVLAIRPAGAARLVDDRLAEVLKKAVSAPVVVLGLGGHDERFPVPPGFGALTGRDAAMATLGVLFESSYAPDRAPLRHSLVKAIAGGATRADVVEWDDTRLVETVGGEVSRILGRDISASFVEIVRHHPGIPQYEIGHRAWLEEVERLTSSMPGLHLTGWGYRGVGVAHLAVDALAVAQRITGRTS